MSATPCRAAATSASKVSLSWPVASGGLPQIMSWVSQLVWVCSCSSSMERSSSVGRCKVVFTGRFLPRSACGVQASLRRAVMGWRAADMTARPAPLSAAVHGAAADRTGMRRFAAICNVRLGVMAPSPTTMRPRVNAAGTRTWAAGSWRSSFDHPGSGVGEEFGGRTALEVAGANVRPARRRQPALLQGRHLAEFGTDVGDEQGCLRLPRLRWLPLVRCR